MKRRKPKTKPALPERIQIVPLACGGLLMSNPVTGLTARVR